jgi:Na+/melibiose symporter-like transporter
VWLTFFAVSLRIMMTFFLVPYYALGAEMTENYRDRTALVAYRNMFSFMAAMITSAIAFTVFFKATSGVGHFLAGLALAMISFPTDQDVSAGDIPEDVLFNLGIVYGPSVLLFGLLTFYAFSFYDITKESHEKTLEILRERRLEGASTMAQDTEPPILANIKPSPVEK